MIVDLDKVDQNKLCDELRKKINQTYKDRGVLEEVEREFQKGIGDNIDTRWTIGSPDFKPLKDVLGYANSAYEQEMYKFLADPDIQHFVLSPEMSFEVHKLNELSMTDTETFKKLIPRARLPYERCCVEVPLTEEVQKFYRDVVPGEAVIRRLGAYIEMKQYDDDSIVYSVYTYHEFEQGSFQCGPIAYINKNDEALDGLHPIRLEGLDTIWNAGTCPLLKKAYKSLSVEEIWEGFGGEAAITLSILDTVHDLGVLFFSWLVLINSKSGVVAKKVPPRLAGSGLGRRQRMRRNRSGYTIIALEDIEYIGEDNVVRKKEIISAHRVRGHFKQKKHGIYWWRPHIRGGGELIEREGYKIL